LSDEARGGEGGGWRESEWERRGERDVGGGGGGEMREGGEKLGVRRGGEEGREWSRWGERGDSGGGEGKGGKE